MKDYRINGRLLSAAKFVRQGARFADIGTDHAYLPLFLLSESRVSYAVCADVNSGPLASAKNNAKAMGITENIDFVLTDGVAALSDRELTDVAICGMGGELIADIVDRAPFLKAFGVRLILGPMSKQAHLRRYLSASGFSVIAEDYVFDSGKYYLTLVVEYSENKEEISDFEAELGSLLTKEALSSAERGYLEAKAKSFKKAKDGKLAGGENMPPEELMYEKIMEMLNAAR